MAQGDAMPIPKKNTAYRVYFPFRDAFGDLISGLTGLDSKVSKDGVAFADCTFEATEIGTTGVCYLDITAAEMNTDCTVIKVAASNTGAKTVVIVLYPAEGSDLMQGAVWDELESSHQVASSFGAFLKRIRQWVSNGKLLVEATGQRFILDDNGSAPKYQIDLSTPATGQVTTTVTPL